MSAVSITHSPSRWIPDSHRRRTKATATTTVAPAPQPPIVPPAAAATTSRYPGGNVTVKAIVSGPDQGQGEVTAVETAGKGRNNAGSRISFAPGTAFHDRSRLKSRGSSQKVAANFHFRPVTPGEKPHTPQMRFKVPKATLPTLHYLSVSQEDFMDPRYAEDIVKTYGIPKYFFKSKSNLLLPPAGKSQQSRPTDGGSVVQAGSEDVKQKDATAMEKEAEDARPKISDPPGGVLPLRHRSPLVVPFGAASPEQRHPVSRPRTTDIQEGNEDMAKSFHPTVAHVYKPLIGEKYTHARFYPPMNPFRSLQMESEVTKYVEHKKRVGLGRYVQFADTGNNIPTSAFLREATMYDLNHEGPAERPLDQFLPPPDRKPFIRQRPRDPKNDFVRSADDRDLVIMSRERTASGVNLKDMVRR